MKRRVAWVVAASVAAFSTVAAIQPAFAATGCRVDYAVGSQWAGGFQASVTVANLGDPVTIWTLGFTFPDAGQKVTQGGSATWASPVAR
jgi:endoglucanase